jgi:hypothetical protein
MANYRYQTVISRNSDENIEEDHWLKRFQDELIGKKAVQPKPIDNFLFDQINSIMNNKSKYPSVAAAVEDMKERSGLAAFLAKTSNNDENDNSKTANEKTASDNNAVINKKVPIGKKLPMVIIKCPHIQKTIENIIKSTRGNLSIPAIIDRARSIHQNDVSDAKDWEADDLLYFISGENLKAKQEHPDISNQSSNLGRRNDSNQDEDLAADNNDAFSALMPAKY